MATRNPVLVLDVDDVAALLIAFGTGRREGWVMSRDDYQRVQLRSPAALDIIEKMQMIARGDE